MDYEKAYKDALEIAKKWRNAPNFDKIPTYANRVIEENFPELAQSEDERIRKEMIDYLNREITISNFGGDIATFGKWIAWLEKQGEPQSYKGNANTMRKNLIKAFKSVGSNHWGGFDVRDILHFLESKEAVELEKQDKSNPYSGVSFEYNGHTWGMCARNNGVDILLDKQIFKHLEKQGGQQKTKTDLIMWKPVSEYKGGRVLATNGVDILVGYINSDGDCESEDCEGTLLCGITGFVKIEDILPKPKESEDEKIKKAIHIYLDWLDGKNKDYQPKGEYTIRDMLAWLEKQGEQKPADKVEPKFKVGDTVTVKPMLYQGKVFKGEPFKIVDIIENNYVSDDGKTYSISLQDGWRLVEQEPIDSYCQENCKGFQETGKCFADGECKAKRDAEQKPADKIEPRFKVGDWVVYEAEAWREVLQIKTTESERYTFTNGSSSSFDEEQYMRLWTIEDARDGDVLAFDNGNIILVKEIYNSTWGWRLSCWCHLLDGEFEVVEYHTKTEGLHPATKEQRDLLFQKMKEVGYEWDADKKVLVMVGIDNNNEDEQYEELMGDDETDLSIEPINEYNTHEPTLEEAKEWNEAYEKGYSLGYENGKNERNPTWSEEDENRCMWIVRLIGTARFSELESDKMPCGRNELIKWLKSLKDKVQPQPKQEWSEEDKMILHEIKKFFTLNELPAFKESCDIIDWLNKLKPQSRWKPTEEQMSVLYWILTYIQLERKNENIIESLYNDLKKL